MVRITFINGSYYCEPGITLLKLKRDSFDRTIGMNRKTMRQRLRSGEIVTFMNICENCRVPASLALSRNSNT